MNPRAASPPWSGLSTAGESDAVLRNPTGVSVEHQVRDAATQSPPLTHGRPDARSGDHEMAANELHRGVSAVDVKDAGNRDDLAAAVPQQTRTPTCSTTPTGPTCSRSRLATAWTP